MMNLKNIAVEILDEAIENRHLGFNRFDSLALAIDTYIERRRSAHEARERWLRLKKVTEEFRRDLERERRHRAARTLAELSQVR